MGKWVCNNRIWTEEKDKLKVKGAIKEESVGCLAIKQGIIIFDRVIFGALW